MLSLDECGAIRRTGDVRILTHDARQPDEQIVREAAEVILRGGIVAYPTDTLYGLAVDPRHAAAVDRVYAAKGRAFDRPLPLVAAGETQVAAWAGDLTPLGRRLAARFWPGPLTLVIGAHPSLCPRVHGATGRVAVRVPAHPVARALARVVGHPITATSANRSGRPAGSTAGDVVAALGEAIDAVIDTGETTGGPPSTIVDVSGATATLVRAGVVPWDRVLEFL